MCIDLGPLTQYTNAMTTVLLFYEHTYPDCECIISLVNKQFAVNFKPTVFVQTLVFAYNRPFIDWFLQKMF